MAEKKRIVMFPFMAHGHLNPFMALAKLLQNRGPGYSITIVNTPLNIKKLRSSLPSQATSIEFAEIRLDAAAYGLPPGIESTEKLPGEFIAPFLEASEDLEAPFKDIIMDITKREGRAPVCIISDMFLAWTLKVARELGMFHSVFIAGCGYGMGVYFSLSLNTELCKCKGTVEEEFQLPDFPEASKLRSSHLGVDLKYNDLVDSWFSFRARQFRFCFASDSILLNSIQELESAGPKYFSRKSGGKPVYMIGPACSLGEKDDDGIDRHAAALFSFLDAQLPGSVVYICFGSQNSILPCQMRELAMGLEASGAAFVWVIRRPSGAEEAILPEGFEGRTRSKNQGFLIRDFAPQVQILSHRSMGAFLSHCGWNSVLESLVCGVPIIGWPLTGEQMFNSQFLEQLGICVEVARGAEPAVSGQQMAQVIRMVIGKTQKGEEMRQKARQVQTQMEDATSEEQGLKGSSLRARDEFLQKATMGERDEVFQKAPLASGQSWAVSMAGIASASHC